MKTISTKKVKLLNYQDRLSVKIFVFLFTSTRWWYTAKNLTTPEACFSFQSLQRQGKSSVKKNPLNICETIQILQKLSPNFSKVISDPSRLTFLLVSSLLFKMSALFSVDRVGEIDIHSHYILIKPFDVFLFHFSNDSWPYSFHHPVHLSGGLSARPEALQSKYLSLKKLSWCNSWMFQIRWHEVKEDLTLAWRLSLASAQEDSHRFWNHCFS